MLCLSVVWGFRIPVPLLAALHLNGDREGEETPHFPELYSWLHLKALVTPLRYRHVNPLVQIEEVGERCLGTCKNQLLASVDRLAREETCALAERSFLHKTTPSQNWHLIAASSLWLRQLSRWKTLSLKREGGNQQALKHLFMETLGIVASSERNHKPNLFISDNVG